MRRIRTPAPGETVILDPNPRRRRAAPRAGQFMTISLEVPRQFAVDFDVRKLLDLIRNELGDALRGRSTPQLERTWSLGPITGGTARAVATIDLRNATADQYLTRVFPRIAPAAVERATAAWLLQAMPPGGGGVNTPARANTRGGSLPR